MCFLDRVLVLYNHLLVSLCTMTLSTRILCAIGGWLLLTNSQQRTTSAQPTTAQTPVNERHITFLNKSGSKVDIYYLNPHDHGSALPLSESPIFSGSVFVVQSFVGQAYRVVERPFSSAAGTICHGVDGACRQTSFVVSYHEEQVVRITETFAMEFEDTKIRAEAHATKLMDQCRAKVDPQEMRDSAEPARMRMCNDKLFTECIHDSLAARLNEVQNELLLEKKARRDMAALLENYTCADVTLNSTTPLREEVWKGAKDARPRNVLILHDQPASQIRVVEHFVTPQECQAVETQAAARTLHRATISDGRGGTRLSPARKALSAGIKIQWDDEQNNNLTNLARRVYDFTNEVLHLDIREHGQENLMSIQYSGRGFNDTEPDQYSRHCDAGCNGLPHKPGGRIATMIMYCDLTNLIGGHTNFGNAGVHVKPEVGHAVFFSYFDPSTGLMDTGFTEHSGCPVFQGQKKIVTQWIRLGVDEDNPWNSFNTLGISKKEREIQEEVSPNTGQAEQALQGSKSDTCQIISDDS